MSLKSPHNTDLDEDTSTWYTSRYVRRGKNSSVEALFPLLRPSSRRCRTMVSPVRWNERLNAAERQIYLNDLMRSPVGVLVVARSIVEVGGMPLDMPFADHLGAAYSSDDIAHCLQELARRKGGDGYFDRFTAERLTELIVQCGEDLSPYMSDYQERADVLLAHGSSLRHFAAHLLDAPAFASLLLCQSASLWGGHHQTTQGALDFDERRHVPKRLDCPPALGRRSSRATLSSLASAGNVLCPSLRGPWATGMADPLSGVPDSFLSGLSDAYGERPHRTGLAGSRPQLGWHSSITWWRADRRTGQLGPVECADAPLWLACGEYRVAALGI
jgi:hypothetical protein